MACSIQCANALPCSSVSSPTLPFVSGRRLGYELDVYSLGSSSTPFHGDPLAHIVAQVFSENRPSDEVLHALSDCQRRVTQWNHRKLSEATLEQDPVLPTQAAPAKKPYSSCMSLAEQVQSEEPCPPPARPCLSVWQLSNGLPCLPTMHGCI